jgi:hypothetical protein
MDPAFGGVAPKEHQARGCEWDRWDRHVWRGSSTPDDSVKCVVHVYFSSSNARFGDECGACSAPENRALQRHVSC